MKFFATLSLFIISIISYSQQKGVSFAAIDRNVKAVPFSDAITLSQNLTRPYKTDLEKTRSIFRWIADNIAYDVDAYHDIDRLYEGIWDKVKYSDSASQKYQELVVEYVLNKKMAVCDGYSRLFKSLCDHAGLKSEIITGYSRSQYDSIGAVKTKPSHAWNAVFIENSWKLLDVTWASGHANDSVTVFTRKYEDYYFLTDPISFFNTHYPEDIKWSMLPHTPSLPQFFNYPFFYPAFYKYGFSFLKPLTGHIEVSRRNMQLQIELGITRPLKAISIKESPDQSEEDSVNAEANASNAEEQVLPYKIENGKLIYTYKVKSDKAKFLQVIYDEKYVLKYYLKFNN
jgi:transglutaminase/protease-like cytokinesis protein 3